MERFCLDMNCVFCLTKLKNENYCFKIKLIFIPESGRLSLSHKFNTMKTIAIPILAVVLSFNLSCEKEQDETVTKTINVTLTSGESYTNKIMRHEDENLAITVQAEHASIAQLNSGTANGEMLFAYTSSEGYVGNDQVQITATQANQHVHGNCPAHNHHDESTVYVYKITVTGETH